MVTLSQTAYFGRKGVNLFFIIVVLVIIARIIVLTSLAIKQKYLPPPPPPPTVTFGKLPYPNGQNSNATPSATTYNLETVEGGFPSLPPSVKVFFMPKADPSFSSFDKIRVLAQRISFTSPPQKTGDTSWRFLDSTNPLRVLDIDELSGNFRLTYNYISDLSVFTNKIFSSQEDVVTAAKDFFGGLGVLTSDLQAGTPSVAPLKWDAGTLVPTTIITNADAVSVTLNRANVDKLPVVSPDANQGLVSLLISASPDPKKKFLEARYLYSQINLEQWSTYPIMKASEAFENLKAGKAIFAALPTPIPSNIVIRKIYLGYLDPYPPQTYLQPVLIFTDQKDFVAYVPVVVKEWLE